MYSYHMKFFKCYMKIQKLKSRFLDSMNNLQFFFHADKIFSIKMF